MLRSKFCIAAVGVLACALVQGRPAFAESAADGSHLFLAAPKTTLEKVRAQGYVRCGSVARPGLAMIDAKGQWSGLELEICRAVATAVFGPDARYAYHQYGSATEYGSSKDYSGARTGQDQVSFLTYTEMEDQKLTETQVPGPVVFVESHDLLVPVGSPFKRLADLAGHGICFMIASAENNSVDAWYQERKIDIIPNAYREDGELWDTYNVQRCQAIAGESTGLAAGRIDGGVNKLQSRFVREHLLSFPIIAATPAKEDAQWAAIVAWTIDTLLNADAHETTYRPSGLRAMAVNGEALGLSKDWQKAVVDRVGSYSAIFRRTLGAESALKLDQGLNKTLAEGGILLPPFKQ